MLPLLLSESSFGVYLASPFFDLSIHMASKNSSRSTSKSSTSTKSPGSLWTPKVLDPSKAYTESQRFDGFSWWLVATPGKLESLMLNFKVLGIIEFEVPSSNEGIIDSEGYASKVALYHSMFSSSLRLPFCHPVCDVLDFLCLAPTQLLPNGWRILISCCVIWR